MAQDKQAVMKALYISLPVAILMLYANYGIWLLDGLPIGTIPEPSQVSRSALWMSQVIGLLQYPFYLLYGSLSAWFSRKDHTNSLLSVVLIGVRVGIIVVLVTRVLRAVEQLTVEGDHPLSRYPIEWLVGLAVGIIVALIIGVALSALGAWTTYMIIKRNVK